MQRPSISPVRWSMSGITQWQAPIVVDKHCVGGLLGNRTTPLVVAIAAANGLVMPKTSSRAITSRWHRGHHGNAGSPVDLDLDTLRKVVEKEGGCVAWGGAMHLSPRTTSSCVLSVNWISTRKDN